MAEQTTGGIPVIVPAHKSRLGVAKIVAQALALAVAIANQFFETGIAFDETQALILVAAIEAMWQGKQQVTRHKIRKIRAAKKPKAGKQ